MLARRSRLSTQAALQAAQHLEAAALAQVATEALLARLSVLLVAVRLVDAEPQTPLDSQSPQVQAA